MKNHFLLATAIACFAFQSLAQSTTKRVEQHESPTYTERFQVLKDSQQVKHGPYELTHRRGKVVGQYEHGKRAGIWESFHDGALVQRYNFTTMTMLLSETAASEKPKPPLPDDMPRYWIRRDGVYEPVVPTLAPEMLGGIWRMSSWINSSLRYPATARRMGVQGMVLTSIVVTKDGLVIDHQLEKGVSADVDQEAMRVIRLCVDGWLPGVVDGERADIKVIIPISFKLAD